MNPTYCFTKLLIKHLKINDGIYIYRRDGFDEFITFDTSFTRFDIVTDIVEQMKKHCSDFLNYDDLRHVVSNNVHFLSRSEITDSVRKKPYLWLEHKLITKN